MVEPSTPTTATLPPGSSRRWLATFATLALWVVALPTSACEDVPYEPVYPECRCVTQACAPSDCSFHLTLDKNCDDDLEFAEVLINDHLEVDTLKPGETFVACSRVPVGDSATLFIRGGSWIWDQTRSCQAPDPGQTGRVIAMTLQCSE